MGGFEYACREFSWIRNEQFLINLTEIPCIILNQNTTMFIYFSIQTFYQNVYHTKINHNCRLKKTFSVYVYLKYGDANVNTDQDSDETYV